MNTLKTLATYEINTDPVDFDAIAAGTKRHMRLGDRGFNVGDYLVMRRTVHPASEVNAGLPLEHGGLEFRCTVASVVRGPDYGLADGWCLLSFRAPNESSRANERQALEQLAAQRDRFVRTSERRALLAGFPPTMFSLLKDVACRTPAGSRGLWQNEHGEAMQDDAEAALEWIARAVVNAQPAKNLTMPPLIGRWHHGSGTLVSGSIRIAEWNCDTNPPDAFRDGMLDWICDTLNTAVEAYESGAPDEFASQEESIPLAQASLPLFAELHPATRALVHRFAMALISKLGVAQGKYGYSDGWRSPEWMDECRTKLVQLVDKGDPLDVAAYCAFLWHHGESTQQSGAVALRGAGPAGTEKPVDMILYCPNCSLQHVDAPESCPCGVDEKGNCLASRHPPSWRNPPHRTHRCSRCSMEWRPADVATNGVAEILTRGRFDQWVVDPTLDAGPVLPDVEMRAGTARGECDAEC